MEIRWNKVKPECKQKMFMNEKGHIWLNKKNEEK